MRCDENGKPFAHKTCAQCNRRDASWWCGGCHLWFHNATPTAKVRSAGQPIPIMAAFTGQMNEDGTPEVVYARMTCADIWHNPARQQFFLANASICEPIHSHSVVSFDQNAHNTVRSNLNFEDVTDVGTSSGGDTTDADDNASP